MKKFINNKLLTYRLFWIIWAFFVLSGIVNYFGTPEEFNRAGSRLLVALIVVGIAALLRQFNKLFNKPSKGEFILGAILLLIEFPFLWIGTALLWSGLIRNLRNK